MPLGFPLCVEGEGEKQVWGDRREQATPSQALVNASASGQGRRKDHCHGGGEEAPGGWWKLCRDKETSPRLVCRQEDFGLDK